MPALNPFGTLPAMPQVSIGRGGTAPSVQYGISSMPVSSIYLGPFSFVYFLNSTRIASLIVVFFFSIWWEVVIIHLM